MNLLRWSLLAGLLAVSAASHPNAALASPREDVGRLLPFWRASAPLCEGAPSGEACHDGDMTLFNGLLCAAGEQLGCRSVREAQDASGRWHRSVRFARDPSLRPHNSFSWDMAIGVQLYAASTGDKAALERWLAWVEEHRPCIVQVSKAAIGTDFCLVRGIPRWCTDDTERGCTAKPNDLAMLATTIRALGVRVPPPAETKLPDGLPGLILKPLVEEAQEANAAFSLSRLVEATHELQPSALLVDAAVNREGYPRHLVAAEILLMRLIGKGSPEVDMAALLLARKDPKNAFFRFLSEGPTEEAAALLLSVAPSEPAGLPERRRDWTWQRAASDEAWKRSKMWDFVFMGMLLTSGS